MSGRARTRARGLVAAGLVRADGDAADLLGLQRGDRAGLGRVRRGLRGRQRRTRAAPVDEDVQLVRRAAVARRKVRPLRKGRMAGSVRLRLQLPAQAWAK